MAVNEDSLENIGIDGDEYTVLAEICRESLWEFVQAFWCEVPGAGTLVPNWHMEYLCQELQKVAERVFAGLPREHDTAVNISPGTSKSTLCSILFPCWIWTRMPNARILTASHTNSLALDLANKARWVINGDLYKRCFPEIELREDQAMKSYYANTHGGDRFTCTVGGRTPLGFHCHVAILDDLIDPKKMLSEMLTTTAREFITNVIPTRKVDKLVSATILIMQRLGLGDPTDVMLNEAKKEGAAPVNHISLPSNLVKNEDGGWVESDVKPEVLAKRYVDGLMDPVRLGDKVLAEYRAKGSFFFNTQFRQQPFARDGGLFKSFYFNQRIRAAPFKSIRIRYWDRASTDKAGCLTAGVLLARDNEGNYYVEDVVAGQWEPTERNNRILATAQRDRARYGPHHEPVIWIEREGGSSGRDAWKGIAKKLAGFRVREDLVTGDKETRAEPWASQLAALNVYIVDGGESEGIGRSGWDVQAYVEDHCAFPGGLKDRIDASSGAFNLLSGNKQLTAPRIYHTGKSQYKGLKFIVCSKDDLKVYVSDDKVLLVRLEDPEISILKLAEIIKGEDELPEQPKNRIMEYLNPASGLKNILDQVTVRFSILDPADCQGEWDKPMDPWGKKPEEVVMGRDHGKKIWSMLLRQRTSTPAAYVLVDDGDGKALSVAMAICDLYRLPRKEAIYLPGRPDYMVGKDDAPPHKHILDVTKLTRASVV